MYTQAHFGETLRSFGNRIAIEENGRLLSYSELLHRSEKVAEVLQDLPPLSPIGVCSNEVTELVIAIAGIIRARCVFVPLDPALPVERLSRMIRESGLSTVLAMPDTFKVPGPLRVITLPLVSGRDSVAGLDTEPEYREDDPLY